MIITRMSLKSIAPAADTRWAPVPRYDGLYLVSNQGMVYSTAMKVTLTAYAVKKHLYVDLYRDGAYTALMLARVVLEAFDGPAPSRAARVVFKNKNPHDCRLINLSWAQTHSSGPSYPLMIVGAMGGRARWMQAAEETCVRIARRSGEVK